MKRTLMRRAKENPNPVGLEEEKERAKPKARPILVRLEKAPKANKAKAKAKVTRVRTVCLDLLTERVEERTVRPRIQPNLQGNSVRVARLHSLLTHDARLRSLILKVGLGHHQRIPTKVYTSGDPPSQVLKMEMMCAAAVSVCSTTVASVTGSQRGT